MCCTGGRSRATRRSSHSLAGPFLTSGWGVQRHCYFETDSKQIRFIRLQSSNCFCQRTFLLSLIRESPFCPVSQHW
jgi:hypothetical protein